MLSHLARNLRGDVNPLYSLRDELKSRGHEIRDLVSGNVNEHGILFPQELLAEILMESSRSSRVYHPDSFGQREAREAISDYYRARGMAMDPDALVLTPGTSVSYWYCFKLLANPGEEILCPRPSYPLFDYIAAISGVRMIPYDLDETRNWSIDLDRLEASISTQTRAVVLISPHNPTGHVSSREEIRGLEQVADRHNLALISDEVFSEFLFDGGVVPRPEGAAPLVFILNGFSKMFALPGIKLGWMGVLGRPERTRPALRALELISDTFLPVSEISQGAAARIFRDGAGFLQSYIREVRSRWTAAEELLRDCRDCSFVPPGGGFYVTLRLSNLDEEQAAETLLKSERLLLHPGYFYDMKPHHLIMSFVHTPELTHDALTRLAALISAP